MIGVERQDRKNKNERVAWKEKEKWGSADNAGVEQYRTAWV